MPFRFSDRPVLPLIALVAVACALPIAAQQPFKADTNLVLVPVVVVDSKGTTVAGLTPADFRVREDGTPVAITTFAEPRVSADGPDQSRFIVVALDNLMTRAEMAYRVRNIANFFVDKLGPYDVMSIIAISGGKAVTTNSKDALRAAVKNFKVSFAADTMSFGQSADHGLRMINSMTEQVVKAPHPRKVMVFIGSAGMFSPDRPSPSGVPSERSVEWDEAIKATARNNVSVYVIDPEGLQAPPGDWSQSFATETGGYAWGRTNNFRAAVDQIFRESASYYLIGYAAPTSDGREHRISVDVQRKGVTIRARRARR